MPAITNETQTAEPATSPAAPSSEKIPAPTMAPTPMKAAWRTDNVLRALDASGGIVAVLSRVDSWATPHGWALGTPNPTRAGWAASEVFTWRCFAVQSAVGTHPGPAREESR